MALATLLQKLQNFTIDTKYTHNTQINKINKFAYTYTQAYTQRRSIISTTNLERGNETSIFHKHLDIKARP